MVLLAWATHKAKSQSELQDQSTKLWKASSWLFNFSLWWQIVTNIGFWAWAFPNEVTYNSSLQQTKVLSDHVVPLFILIGDWLLNAISTENQQLLPNMSLFGSFIVTNVIVKETTGF